MIKIDRRRVDCPDSLGTTTRDLVKGDYKKDDVLDALLKIQHFKCCYCEKDLSELGKSARWVDHFIPRSDDSFKNSNGEIDWNRANAWENLLYACSTCNIGKGGKKPFDSNGTRRLIDPSYRGIDPEEHIGFLVIGLFIVHREKTNLGKDTIGSLEFKIRADVHSGLRKRKLEIEGVFADLMKAIINDKTITVNSKLAELKKATSADQPYASFSRQYITQRVDEFNNIELPQIKQNYGKNFPPIKVKVANGCQAIE